MISKRKQREAEQRANKKADFEGFLKELRQESDRAAAILGAAYLDQMILDLIKRFLVEDEVEELLENDKPLGAFGARIRAAYALGLISKEAFQDLKIIKAIRNEFAHELHGLSFDEESIANKCQKLQAHNRAKRDRPSSSRDKFIFTMQFILLELTIVDVMIEGNRLKVPANPTDRSK